MRAILASHSHDDDDILTAADRFSDGEDMAALRREAEITANRQKIAYGSNAYELRLQEAKQQRDKLREMAEWLKQQITQYTDTQTKQAAIVATQQTLLTTLTDEQAANAEQQNTLAAKITTNEQEIAQKIQEREAFYKLFTEKIG